MQGLNIGTDPTDCIPYRNEFYLFLWMMSLAYSTRLYYSPMRANTLYNLFMCIALHIPCYNIIRNAMHMNKIIGAR